LRNSAQWEKLVIADNEFLRHLAGMPDPPFEAGFAISGVLVFGLA